MLLSRDEVILFKIHCRLTNMFKYINSLFLTGKTLPEIIQVFNRLISEVQGSINTDNLKIYTDYFFSTFMTHFKLYQYVFTINRERMQIKVSKSVDTPSDPMPFTEAKDVDVYEYEQKYKHIETEEKKAQEERFKRQEQSKLEDFEKLHNSLQTVDNAESPLDRQVCNLHTISA